MKYCGICLFLIAITIVAWAWHSNFNSAALTRASSEANMALLRAQKQLSVSPNQYSELARVDASLANLRKLRYPQHRSYQFIAVEEPQAAAVPEDSPLLKAGLDQTAHRYEVSMVFITADARYAVIDGQFCQVGGVLPFGGRVVSISAEGVEVTQAGGTQKLSVKGAAKTTETGIAEVTSLGDAE